MYFAIGKYTAKPKRRHGCLISLKQSYFQVDIRRPFGIESLDIHARKPIASVFSRITPRRYGLRRFLFHFSLTLAFFQPWTFSVAVRRHLPLPPERIYIASLHWNNEAILRDSRNDAIIRLAEKWGAENVFGGLRDLDLELDRLGIRRNITLSTTSHRDEIPVPLPSDGWVDTPRGRTELRRKPHLARLRNLTLRPLEDLKRPGILFDKALFLGDVVFTVDDVLELLNTNDGVYSAACSLDFMRTPAFYDTFALRDSKGDGHIMQTWPYFSLGMYITAPDCLANGDPISGYAHRALRVAHTITIHADNPLSERQDVYLNPRVPVHPIGAWLSPRDIALGVWRDRLLRCATTTGFQKFVVNRRVALWQERLYDRLEVGEFCLVNEMQVLAAHSWAHV
ncbi:cryptococcal mannosyltransferase 1-domain-containing protein [Aspergillus falconensis]